LKATAPAAAAAATPLGCNVDDALTPSPVKPKESPAAQPEGAKGDAASAAGDVWPLGSAVYETLLSQKPQ
jgi:hypothetical protein